MNKALLLTTISAFTLVLAALTAIYADNGARADSQSFIDADEAHDDGCLRDNLIDNSWNDGATGIVHDQQNNGSYNGISASTAVAGVGGNSDDITQKAEANKTHAGADLADTNDANSERRNAIDGIKAFSGALGVVTVQQNNGDANSLIASTGLVFAGGETGDTSKNMVAAGFSARNFLLDADTCRNNHTFDSFPDAQGIATLQQNNSMGSAITAVANGITFSFGAVNP